MEILHDVYQEFKLENIKFSKFSNETIYKKLTCNYKNPLYNGFNLDKFSFNFQCVKWAEESGNLVLYNDSFVKT